MYRLIIFSFLSITLLSYSIAFAVDVAPRISDKEIIESLAELKAGQLALQQQLEDIKESTNNRFDDVDNRFDDMNNRFDDLTRSTNNRFDDLTASTNDRFDTLQWMLGLFITVALSMLGVMGRILWSQQQQITEIKSSLETYNDELAFLKILVEKLLPPKGVL